MNDALTITLLGVGLMAFIGYLYFLGRRPK